MSTVERILQAAGMAGKVRGPYRGYGDIDDKETRERWAKALGF